VTLQSGETGELLGSSRAALCLPRHPKAPSPRLSERGVEPRPAGEDRSTQTVVRVGRVPSSRGLARQGLLGRRRRASLGSGHGSAGVGLVCISQVASRTALWSRQKEVESSASSAMGFLFLQTHSHELLSAAFFIRDHGAMQTAASIVPVLIPRVPLHRGRQACLVEIRMRM